jgi:hypothetical protein
VRRESARARARARARRRNWRNRRRGGETERDWQTAGQKQRQIETETDTDTDTDTDTQGERQIAQRGRGGGGDTQRETAQRREYVYTPRFSVFRASISPSRPFKMADCCCSRNEIFFLDAPPVSKSLKRTSPAGGEVITPL